MLRRRPDRASSARGGRGQKLDAAPRVRATGRIKVQLLFSSSFSWARLPPGPPSIGARLTVGTAVDRGVPSFADLPTDVVTDAKGRFKVTLPRGPSWRVRVLYFARALDAAPAGHDDARVRVATHATFAPRKRHMRRGQRAVFRGHVVGSYRPTGIPVELQGRRHGSYVTLATAATRPDGTYRVSYAFTSGARGRYVFRLRVRHFPRFPYFLGYSSPANVFVR